MICDSKERDPFTSKRSFYDHLPTRPQPQQHCMPSPVSYEARGGGMGGCRGNRDLQRVYGKEGAEEGAGGKADRLREIERA